jgi:phosphate transport system substrate-binding protein
MKAWQDGFHRYQPDVRFKLTLYGTASVVGALYEDATDIGVLGEEVHPSSAAAFLRVKHYPPLALAIATGSVRVKNFAAANIFYVNRDNPLAGITLAQLDGILGSEHRRGLGNLRTWGQLGLTGEWADKPIHPYTWLLAESFCLYLQRAILEDSHEWNSAVTEFVAGKRADGSPYDDGEQILDAVSNDRYGIGVSCLPFLKPHHRVKALAIAACAGGPYVSATERTAIDESYPLTRFIPAVIDRPPGRPVEPKVREFLRYLLSRDGQADFVRTTGYLPLSQAMISEQLKKLE